MSTFAYGGLVEQVTNTTAAAGTTTLTNVSKQVQILNTSGGSGQTYTLPDATTMIVGQKFEFYNKSAGTLTINTNGGALLATVATNLSSIVKLTNNGTSAGTWVQLKSSTGGGGSYTPPTVQKFTVTGTATGLLFVLPGGSTANATAGATYTNNGATYTILYTIAGGGNLMLLASNPTSTPISGTTLTKATGTGDATITISYSRDLATYTTPTSPSTPLYLKVRLVGAGGGGSTSGQGGDATEGRPSVFGNTYAFGGTGGLTVSTSSSGTGGLAYIVSGATGIALQGGTGDGQPNTANTGGGGGAATPFGGAGRGGSGNVSENGQSAVANTGAGGGGGAGDGTRRGGSGGSAGGYVDAIFTSPASIYYYAVGVKGSGGTGGASNGGDGADGYVIIEEHYQ